MALADITLNDGQGTPQAHTFTYTGTVNNRIIRSNLSAAPETPENLSLAHSKSVKGGVTSQSHLWRIDLTVLDSDGVTPYNTNIRVMADIPNPVLTDALLSNLGAYVRNAFTDIFVKAWGKGSVG